MSVPDSWEDAAGSPSFALPFCDPALDVGARVDDLLARLSPALKLQQGT